MQTATFTESEIDFILDKLFKYAMFDEDVETVCRILILQFPDRVVEGKLERVKESHDKRGVQRIFKKSKMEDLQK